MNSNFLARLRIVGFGIVFVMLLIVAKLFFVQIIHHEEYVIVGNEQYTSKADGIFNRGSIFFTKKDGTLLSAATLALGYKIIISPKDITDPEAVYTALNAIVPLDHDDVIQKAKKPGDAYEVLAERIDETSGQAVRALGIKGVRLESQKWRFYPGNELASKVIGFVAFKGDDLIGRYGLERTYNDVLTRNKDDLYVNFFAELFTSLRKQVFTDEHREGDIITTIEPVVQHTLEKTLRDFKEKWQVEQAGGIIIDPHTGDILALAAVPDFDVNKFSEVKDLSRFGNPLVENSYELGSIMKPLTIAAGIDAGVITPETTYTDTGCIVVNTERICNFDGEARKVINMQTVLSQSLNTGSVFVMQKLGKERFRKYFYGYGMTEKTDIDLPGEVKSNVRNLESTRDIEYATASFGQGIALSPIAMVRAFTALANDGVLVSPRVVKEIRYPDGISYAVERPTSAQVLKPETAETVTRMLVKVVDEGYGGGRHKLEHYAVAAKTGTAQLAQANARGYEEGRVLHSIMSYYPAYDPKFLVLMFGVNPQGARFSSETFVNPLMELVKFTLTYYDVAPDR